MAAIISHSVGTVVCIAFLLHTCSSRISQKDHQLINSLKQHVDLLVGKFDAVLKENAELRNRVAALEQDKDDVVKLGEVKNLVPVQRGRRQFSSATVAFSAYLDHPLKGLTRGAPILYNRVITNDGNGYHNTTGVFQAPAMGLYLFSWSTTARQLSGQSAYDEWTDLVVDGTKMLSAVAESMAVSDDNQGSNTVVLRIKKGQEVWIQHRSAFDTIHGSDVERSTSFTGVMLYELE